MQAERDFLNIGGRWVHYQSWGEGPVILALHGSPQSSRTMVFLAEALVELGFRVIAPDTPGNGFSDPLPTGSTADTSHFAHALHDFAQALGLEAFGLYGFHTGAAIACTYAALYPERVAALFFDGLPAWSPEDDEALAGYLRPLEPSWDGAHMAWLWSRIEEQSVFFPWHHARLEYRMDYDVSSTARCHANVMDMLHAGNHYATPYRSALKFRPEAWLDLLQCDFRCTAQSDDPLRLHLGGDVLRDRPQEVFADFEAMLAGAGEFFAARRERMKAAKGPARRTEGSQRGCITVAGYTLAWTLNPAPRNDHACPLLLLHDAGDAASSFRALVNRLALKRPVLTLDLPGHGMSRTTALLDPETPLNSVEALADIVARACKALGIQQYAVIGRGLGGQIAAALVAGGHSHAAASIGASVYTESEQEDYAKALPASLSPEWDGAHLLRAWRIARWERLFFPWYKRDRQHALPGPYSLDNSDIQQRAVNLLSAGSHGTAAQEAAMSFDLPGALPANANFQVFAIPGDPLSTPERMGALKCAGKLPSLHPTTWASAFENFGT